MPSESTTRILFVGDMHLGRRPSGLPGDLSARTDLGPAEAWQRVVTIAIEHQVQAVALAGDLVHQDNAAFGAYGPLENGVRRLAEAGIPVCAVAGNHDASTLPSLAENIAGFTLMGSSGTWSELRLTSESRPEVRLVGWSFPREHHLQSPFNSPLPAADSKLITLGLLHCDLGASRSKYAPVTAEEFRTSGYDGWFLGHEHIPGDPAIGGPFYLGSLTPLDPSETGSHGPVLVTIPGAGHSPTAERLPLAPVRWENLELPVPQAADPRNDLQPLLLARAISHRREIENENPDLLALGLRITLTGQVEDPDAWDRACRALDFDDLKVEQDHALVFIQKVQSGLRIQRDLMDLARGNDPAGLLARRILVLENTGGKKTGEPVPGVSDSAKETERLVAMARARLEEVDHRPALDRITWGDESQSEEEVRQTVQAALAHVARRTLDRLLGQKAGDRATD
ncbi:MAG: DNA repair exonuclease [Gemmatimonadales bacterium]|nr:DNA repair exonuclease [Gemmatimonadales bacterium]